ncbi:hypothetical protein GCM10010112_82060 [Actinoplanes lobatus]|uniref:Uncharacterized protein n=1 Tax=Actinoplanes lobatus TaxID=113568 RepID=A0A7W7HLI6_9ACTN|nr:hypothetical protein [Actinoplanes lobatus]MBB4752620.1 hypothetical protein [Actinoplanes lobatus]GGN93615.1 hypothetical protein GCM10010112_82060 [Actinoplanes lobatus]GIE44715.1 hypothetical protein Alo02nite_76130 [Actinoplanes lobatus]
MPTDHLTTAPLAARVESLIAGHPTSADYGTDADLAEAVETYRAAGRAALQHHQEQRWFQARVTPLDWACAEADIAAQVAPHLDRMHCSTCHRISPRYWHTVAHRHLRGRSGRFSPFPDQANSGLCFGGDLACDEALQLRAGACDLFR